MVASAILEHRMGLAWTSDAMWEQHAIRRSWRALALLDIAGPCGAVRGF